MGRPQQHPRCFTTEEVLPLIADMSNEDAAEFVGVNKKTVERWRRGRCNGRLDLDQADKFACKLGLHIDLIWDREKTGV